MLIIAEKINIMSKTIGPAMRAREALAAPVGGIVARADAAVGQVVAPSDLLQVVAEDAGDGTHEERRPQAGLGGDGEVALARLDEHSDALMLQL